VPGREEARAETAAQKEAEKQAKAQERTMARAERGAHMCLLHICRCVTRLHRGRRDLKSCWKPIRCWSRFCHLKFFGCNV